jgi:alpha-L-fucosidase
MARAKGMQIGLFGPPGDALRLFPLKIPRRPPFPSSLPQRHQPCWVPKLLHRSRGLQAGRVRVRWAKRMRTLSYRSLRIGAWLSLGLVCASLLHAGQPAEWRETPQQKDARMKWWREARFGMFIHWGLYAVPAGEWNGKKYGGGVEWIMNQAKVPVAEYRPLLAKFNPVKYDPNQWVALAKRAGMRYLVITSKHHDGFCLWPSQYTDWDVASTAWGRDLLKPLSEACRRQGIVFCTYHSIMDWTHPDYLPRRDWDPRPGVAPDFDRYVAHLKNQLAELVHQYHPAVMWFDGEWEKTWNFTRGKDLALYVHSLDPKILINNRVDATRSGMQGMSKGETAGDFGTPEQEIPPQGLPGVDWESCMTMNDTWGYSAHDTHWKSASQLIRNLVDTASKGGNYLLNVGPTGEGLIPPASVERLEAVGQWMQVNSASIYGTSASPFKKLPFEGRCTVKGRRLYLHVYRWPEAGLEVKGLGVAVKSARALLGNEKLKTTSVTGGVAVGRPAQLDPCVTVVELTVAGPPVVAE